VSFGSLRTARARAALPRCPFALQHVGDGAVVVELGALGLRERSRRSGRVIAARSRACGRWVVMGMPSWVVVSRALRAEAEQLRAGHHTPLPRCQLGDDLRRRWVRPTAAMYVDLTHPVSMGRFVLPVYRRLWRLCAAVDSALTPAVAP
jgi:hypothetical protein